MTDEEEDDHDILEIDQNRLDFEWGRQAKLMGAYTRKLAIAKEKVLERKRSLELTRVEIAREVRENPGDFNVGKVTEGAISEVILEQDPYQNSLKSYNKAIYRVDLIQSIVTGLDHKRRALENLVYLHGQGYFSTPRTKTRLLKGDEAAESMGEMSKRALRGRSKRRKSENEEYV